MKTQESQTTADGAGLGLTVSVVIPCYNEEDAIVSTLQSVSQALAELEPFEIVVVDDGSTDKSTEHVAEYIQHNPRVRLIRHGHNRGYGASLKTGIRRSKARYLAITDADGTYPNERLPEFLAAAEHCEMVVGVRAAADQALLRRIAKHYLRRYCSWLAGQPIPDMNSGMRVFRRDAVESFLGILPNGFSFTTTITLALLTNHHEVTYLPIAYHARIGRSKIQPLRDTLNFMQLILRTGMYFAPMRVLGPPALLLLLAFVASFIYDAWVLRNLTDKTLLLLLFGGQTLILALLADMIDKRQGR